MRRQRRRGGRASAELTRQCLEYYGRECWLQLPGCTRVATTKDHVIPYAAGGTDALDNLRPACQPCNSKRQDRKHGALVRIITGPPAAGKTTYVQEHAYPGDVVIDLDALAQALMPPGTTSQPPQHIRHVAIGARKAAIARATRLKENVGIWIIHSLPTPDQLQEYKQMGWQVITIDPGEQVIRQRIADAHNGTAHGIADRWYNHSQLEHQNAIAAPSRDWGVS